MSSEAKKMPKFYSLGEEIFSAVTHGVGSLCAIAGTVILIVLAACHASWIEVVSVSIYGASMIILYTMSTLYHALHAPRAKKVFRVFDHATIFLLIAGTYTPLMLISLRGNTKGVVIFVVVWLAAVLGIVANSISLEKFAKASVALYIIMGWAVVFAFMDVVRALPTAGLVMLIGGGVAYTGGVVFYKSKRKWMHSIWHLFVLAGSALHYFCILFYALIPAYTK